MKHAGVDKGSSLTKVAFKDNDGNWIFLSTADHHPSAIARELANRGITELNVCGINRLDPTFQDFKINCLPGNPIDNEIKLQANGVREMLRDAGYNIKKFLLVSVGTGTSYTFVQEKTATRFPIGNSLGGGFLNGLAHYLHIGNELWNPCDALSDSDSLDLLVKDLMPVTSGTAMGDIMVANFGKIKTRSSAGLNAIKTALLNVVAIAVSRDITILNLISGLTGKHAILYVIGTLLKMRGKNNATVVIGSAIQRSANLRKMISSHCKKHLNIMPIFPDNAAYALAIGAYFMNKKNK